MTAPPKQPAKPRRATPAPAKRRLTQAEKDKAWQERVMAQRRKELEAEDAAPK